MKKLILITMVALTAAPAMADLIENGSFELGQASIGGFTTLDSGSTAINDWRVIGSVTLSIDYIGSYWTASDGVRSLDLNGNPGPGGVEQDIDTIVGNSYLVKFDMAGNSDGAPTQKTMDVSAIGAGTQTQGFVFNASGSNANMNWQTMQWSFVADVTGLTTLRFMSTTVLPTGGPTPYGPALDNVSVVPVPGALLLGMLGLGVAGARLRKRNA